MSKFGAEFTVDLPLAEALIVCREACSHTGWRLLDDNAQPIRCTEVQTNAFGFTNPVQVTITIRPNGPTSTVASIQGSSFGFGPIQSRHVRAQVEALGERIIAEGSQRTVSPTEVGNQSAVYVNGRLLNDNELSILRQMQGAVPPPGRYWYDTACGGWGMEGGPQGGITAAGMKLGGPLRTDASNGSTGVFINGRQLHNQDVATLSALVGSVVPGRWWVDAHGNFGMEGWPMVGNLFVMMQARMAPKSGGSSGSTGRYGEVTSDGTDFFFRGPIGSGLSAWTG